VEDPAVTFAQRFIGVETLPSRMSELDVQQFFSLSKDDICALCERFRDDLRVAAAIQLLFLRASGRPMDRFATVPKVLLRSVCEALGSPSVSIASLPSLYERRQTLYEHQAWARTYVGLGDLDEIQLQKIEQVLAVAALEAAHPDDLVRTTRIWLCGRRIIIPGSRRIADWACKAFDATEAGMAATIEAAIGKAALRQAIDWAYAPSPATSGSHLEWLKTPPRAQRPEHDRGRHWRASHSWGYAVQQGRLNARWGSGRSRNPAALDHTPKKCGLQARR
jgi:hypothetical protein